MTTTTGAVKHSGKVPVVPLGSGLIDSPRNTTATPETKEESEMPQQPKPPPTNSLITALQLGLLIGLAIPTIYLLTAPVTLLNPDYLGGRILLGVTISFAFIVGPLAYIVMQIEDGKVTPLQAAHDYCYIVGARLPTIAAFLIPATILVWGLLWMFRRIGI